LSSCAASGRRVADGARGAPILPFFARPPRPVQDPPVLERNTEKRLARVENRWIAASNSAEKICMTQTTPSARGGLRIRGVLFTLALAACGLSGGCVRCCVPLNAPPYDPNQYGWGPRDRYVVTENRTCLPKIKPCFPPFLMSPPCRPSGCCPYPSPCCPPQYCPTPPWVVSPAFNGCPMGPPVPGSPNVPVVPCR
jgi:hypothetical protein